MQPTQSSTLRRTSVGDVASNDDIGDREASARLEHPERLAQNGVLVVRQVDDAVRDDHVHRIAGSGIASIVPFRNSTLVAPASR